MPAIHVIHSTLAESREHDAWRSNDPPAVPPMTCDQALQLMYLHQKAVLQLDEPDYLKRRRGESNEAHSERLACMSEERDRRAREEFEVAEVERWERGEPAWGPAGEDVRAKLAARGIGPTPPSAAFPTMLRIPGTLGCSAPPVKERGFGLPDLAQVTGWSRADPNKAAHHEGVALFGGWRIEDMEAAVSRRRPGSSPKQSSAQ